MARVGKDSKLCGVFSDEAPSRSDTPCVCKIVCGTDGHEIKTTRAIRVDVVAGSIVSNETGGRRPH